MAFDAELAQALLKPTIEFTKGNWALEVILPNVTFAGTLNDYTLATTLSKPTLLAVTDVPAGFYGYASIQKPVISAGYHQDFTGDFAGLLKKPQLTFNMFVGGSVTVQATLPKPVFAASIDSAFNGIVSARLRMPTLRFGAILGGTSSRATWSFNTITTAHSRYENYDFNSFFKLGSKYYGVHTNGTIYELTGDVDFGTEVTESIIDAEVTFPASQFGEQQNKVCSDAFVYGRSTGEMEVQLKLDEQEERTGFTVTFDDRAGMHRRRVKIPKGLKGNVWQYKLKNIDGSNFDINAFEIFVRSVQRII